MRYGMVYAHFIPGCLSGAASLNPFGIASID